MMTVGSLFAGIGGFDLGLERAGMKTVWQVELDEYCQRVLAKHWPDVERYSDVRECGAHNLKRVDLVCGGFPCQPVSHAGKRQGDADERWLWPEFARVVCELEPRWVLAENVPGLLSIDDGRLFGTVLRDLASLGYAVEWECIPAAAVGAPHIRDRVWIVAYTRSVGMDLERRGITGAGGQGAIFAHRDGAVREVADANCGRQQECPQFDSDPLHNATDRSTQGQHAGRRGDEVADANQPRLENGLCESSEQAAQRTVERSGCDVADADESEQRRRATWFGRRGTCESSLAKECRRHNSETDGIWSTEPDVGRVASRIPFELDCIGRLNNGNSSDPKAYPEVDWRLVGRFLRSVWEYKALATASPRTYRARLLDSVPTMPHGHSYEGWDVGTRLETTEELHRVWREFYAQPLEKAHDLQQALLERIRAEKCPQALAARVDRLRALGNAVVPQVVEWIGRRIVEADAG